MTTADQVCQDDRRGDNPPHRTSYELVRRTAEGPGGLSPELVLVLMSPLVPS